MRRFSHLVAGTLLASTVIAAPVGPVSAGTFPGANGRIAFVSSDGSDLEIYTMDGDGSNVTQITTNAVEDRQPSWDPTGTKIAFIEDSNVWVMDANGASPTPLTSSGGDGWPSWSPSGSRIVFEEDGDIWSVKSAGGGLRQLTSGPASDQDPEWSPNANLIAFTRNGRIWLMTSKGTNLRRVTNRASNSSYPESWSPDGTRILYSSNGYSSVGYDFYSIKPNGRGRRVVAQASGDQEYGSFSPDGSEVVYSDNSGGDWEIVTQAVPIGLPIAITNNSVTDWEADWQAT